MTISKQELLKLLWWGECDFTLTADKKLKDPTGKVVGRLKKSEFDVKDDAPRINRVSIKMLNI